MCSLQAPHSLYKPNQNLIRCKDPLCVSLHTPENSCDAPEEQCDYEVQYADHGSSLGVLVHDSFPLRFNNGSTLSPRLAFGFVSFLFIYIYIYHVKLSYFGMNWCFDPNLAFIICSCGYNQEIPDSSHPPFTDGVLGLGIGKSSVLEQLHNLGLTRNVVGHCLSAQGGGFLFFGDDFVPSSGIVWAPFSSKKLE